jgi:hypothetical protein
VELALLDQRDHFGCHFGQILLLAPELRGNEYTA